MNSQAVKDKVAAIVNRALLKALAEIAPLLQQPITVDAGDSRGSVKLDHLICDIDGGFTFRFKVGMEDSFLRASDFYVSPTTLPASHHEQ